MPPKLLLSGLDTLHLSYFQDTATSALDFVDLESRKATVAASRDVREQAITLGGRNFKLMPYGASGYRFLLAAPEFDLRLSETLSPSCFAAFRSVGLWSQGETVLDARMRDWFRAMKMAPLRPEKVSRADFAFDFHLPVRDFDANDVVSYLAKNSTHRSHQIVETISFGKGALVVRIYDKSAEIEAKSKKRWFYELWNRKDDVWRVEVQLRGDILEHFGVRTLSQWNAAKRHILGVIARDRFSIRRPNGDSNRSRWPLNPLWEAVLEAIEAMPQSAPMRAFSAGDSHKRRCLDLAVNMVGQAASYAASDYLSGCRSTPLALDAVFSEIASDYFKTHSQAMFDEKVEQAIAKREGRS